MTAELNRYFFQKKETDQYLKFLIVSQCAPFLKRMRATSLLTIPDSTKIQMVSLLSQTEIMWRELGTDKGKSICILYREPDLKELLGRPENHHILYINGYPDINSENLVEIQLKELKKRMKQFISKGKFPHEIGVFLGYPASDVEQFIEQDGQNYKMNGYWKVYDHVMDAARIFSAYDQARMLAVNELLLGYDLKMICR